MTPVCRRLPATGGFDTPDPLRVNAEWQQHARKYKRTSTQRTAAYLHQVSVLPANVRRQVSQLAVSTTGSGGTITSNQTNERTNERTDGGTCTHTRTRTRTRTRISERSEVKTSERTPSATHRTSTSQWRSTGRRPSVRRKREREQPQATETNGKHDHSLQTSNSQGGRDDLPLQLVIRVGNALEGFESGQGGGSTGRLVRHHASDDTEQHACGGTLVERTTTRVRVGALLLELSVLQLVAEHCDVSSVEKRV
jgi:hypothetical protein